MRKFLLAAADNASEGGQVQRRRALTMGRLPNPMQAMCPTCKTLCICQGTETKDSIVIQNRRCPQCGFNIRLHIR